MNQSFDGYIAFSADLLTVRHKSQKKRGLGDFSKRQVGMRQAESLVIKPNRDGSVAK